MTSFNYTYYQQNTCYHLIWIPSVYRIKINFKVNISASCRRIDSVRLPGPRYINAVLVNKQFEAMSNVIVSWFQIVLMSNGISEIVIMKTGSNSHLFRVLHTVYYIILLYIVSFSLFKSSDLNAEVLTTFTVEASFIWINKPSEENQMSYKGSLLEGKTENTQITN